MTFVKEIFELQFEETPDYRRLRFLLVKGLLDSNVAPDNNFDWCRYNIETSSYISKKKVRNVNDVEEIQCEENAELS